MKILGISAFYHDSAAAVIVNGEIVAAAQEERFTRKKHDAAFPLFAVKYCLDEANIELSDLDGIAFYDKPLLKFERLLETYYAFAPKGIQSFIKSIPIWIREKMFLKRIIWSELDTIQKVKRADLKLYFPTHHLSHAASAYFPSPFKDAAILTIDGVGEWATASICKGEGNKIKVIKELKFPHSLGLLYSAFTYFLGFSVNSGEYKLMGLAPYGIPNSENVLRFKGVIKSKLIQIYEDGSIWMNQRYFRYATGLRMVKDQEWSDLFNVQKRNADDEIEQIHCDLALAIQQVTEEVVEKMARHAMEICQSSKLCLAGGVALNCVANGKIINKSIFNDVFIQPAAGDAGGAVGAGLALHYLKTGARKKSQQNNTYLGPSFSGKDILKLANRYGAVYDEFELQDHLYAKVAKLIDEGFVIGWFQGRMEFGPRALGNRSILGDPRNEQMQKKLNIKIKNRESFRPFAPSVLKEDAKVWFDLKLDSPYMLQVASVQLNKRNSIPEDYYSLPLMDRLYVKRSEIPAVTHIDFSARVQTVEKASNPAYWNLLQAFKKESGIGMLINTSFNVRGEPIVCTPEDAYRCFLRTEMDYLVIENCLFKKTEQLQSSIDRAKKDTFQKD